MPKKRLKNNDGFPDRWQWHHGWITYRVPPGQEHAWDGKKRFRLGQNAIEAYKTWAERLPAVGTAKTIGDGLDAYALRFVPTCKPRTRKNKLIHIPKLKKVFGTVPLHAIKPHHAYRYVNEERKGTVEGLKECKTLSHAYTWFIQQGWVTVHPFKGQVVFTGITGKKSGRYVEDDEILEVLSLPAKKWDCVEMCQAYIRVKLLTGFRQTDLLGLSPAKHFTEQGIVIPAMSKTDKPIAIGWSPELKAATDLAKAARPVDISPFLFCKRDGTSYLEDDNTAGSFDSVWKRFMARCLKETKLGKRFAERNLRNKAGSDEESLERARQLLGHADARVTQRFYRNKVQYIQPAAGGEWVKGKKE
jgi:integrase